jgi:hypothetical protein
MYRGVLDWTFNMYCGVLDWTFNMYRGVLDWTFNMYRGVLDWTFNMYRGVLDWTFNIYRGVLDVDSNNQVLILLTHAKSSYWYIEIPAFIYLDQTQNEVVIFLCICLCPYLSGLGWLNELGSWIT